MNKGFFGSLFDFSFTSFVTTKIIPILYGISLLSVVLVAIALFIRGGGGVLAGVFVLVFGVIYARVVMETIIVFFRIAEHTRDTARALTTAAALSVAAPPAATPAPGGSVSPARPPVSSEIRFDTETGKPLDQP